MTRLDKHVAAVQTKMFLRRFIDVLALASVVWAGAVLLGVLIQRMLTRTCWNRKEAAEILGISYKALLYKIKEGGLDKAS